VDQNYYLQRPLFLSCGSNNQTTN